VIDRLINKEVQDRRDSLHIAHSVLTGPLFGSLRRKTEGVLKILEDCGGVERSSIWRVVGRPGAPAMDVYCNWCSKGRQGGFCCCWSSVCAWTPLLSLSLSLFLTVFLSPSLSASKYLSTQICHSATPPTTLPLCKTSNPAIILSINRSSPHNGCAKTSVLCCFTITKPQPLTSGAEHFDCPSSAGVSPSHPYIMGSRSRNG
jgi:hypothetical protein